jgi:hypothetical protein
LVDWSKAPADAIYWVYDARASRGRWLNGDFEVEEFGVMWDWKPAPSFGATSYQHIERPA